MLRVKDYWHWFFVVIAFALGLYLRISNPWNAVFIQWIEGARLSGNDPWYYFRLIDTTLQNFPDRIWFDAFTNYPYGTYTHFGPFLVYLSLFLSKIASASNLESIRTVISFIPAFGGALLAIPVYIFTSRVFNKHAGVIASLLVVIIPGQLLHRSVLSFNDHHIWEVFWQSFTLAFFALSLEMWKGKNARENVGDIRKLIFPVMTGISLGFYLLSWAPGFVIGFIVVFYILLCYLFRNVLELKTENLACIGVLTFTVAFLMYLPFAFKAPGFSTTRYTPFQLVILLGLALLTVLFHVIEILEKRGVYRILKRGEKYAFPATVVALVVASIFVIPLLSPDFFNLLNKVVGVIQPKGGALTVAEIQPFFVENGEFTLANAWRNFSMTFFFAVPGMLYAIYALIRQKKPLYLFALIWGFAMFVALTGQNRFAYYFGVVSATFAAAALDAILRNLNFYEFIGIAISGENALKKIGFMKPMIAVFLIIILFYPTLADANFQAKYSAGGINKHWYDALVWMRNNTPGREMYDSFYYELYRPNPDLKKPYPFYPNGTYGVMSWWDYGHWITAIAHRIPNANPFQQGIGNKYNRVPGAAPFFTAYNESEANEIAEKLGVKYVITDVEMATGKFYAMAVWAEGTLERASRLYYLGPGFVYVTPGGQLGISLSKLNIPIGSRVLTVINVPSEKYFKTMEAKFHIMDGSGLKRYRMVYESGFESRRQITIEMLYRFIYDSAHAREDPVPVTSTGYVKIFEYVRGAKITGKVDDSVKKVVISANITTNQNRTFVYKQVSKVVDGKYELIVPYAQETAYPVKASKYRIIAGNESRVLSLTDTDIEIGRTFIVDFV